MSTNRNYLSHLSPMEWAKEMKAEGAKCASAMLAMNLPIPADLRHIVDADLAVLARERELEIAQTRERKILEKAEHFAKEIVYCLTVQESGYVACAPGYTTVRIDGTFDLQKAAILFRERNGGSLSDLFGVL